MLVLVTGATGKVGQVFLRRFLADPQWTGAEVRALCHNRALPAQPRLTSITGTISDRATVARALEGVTHVVHMATVKETPDEVMDVSVKGMFWLLEEFRVSPTARQFMLIGGDCVVGHIFVPYDAPIIEASPRRPYPGCYALSKVIEETMLESYFTQYDLNGVTLRAPWIMDKDDFRYVLSFGDDQFGGPAWTDLIADADRRRLAADGAIPILLDHTGRPLQRNFVHVEDLVSAMLLALDSPAARQQLFNIAMTTPVDYAEVAAHLAATRNLRGVAIASGYYSNRLDNSKARQALAWEPQYDLPRLIDSAYGYVRAPDNPRKIWYAG